MNEILGSLAFVMDRITGIISSDEAESLRFVVGDRIHAGIAPPRTSYPLVLVQSLSSRDNTVIGGESAYLIADLVIKLVGTGGYEELGEADSAIFKMLQTASGTVDESLHCMGCHRTNTLTIDRSEGDAIYRSLISTWRVRMQKTG